MLHRIAFPVVSVWYQQRHCSFTILLTRASIRSTSSTSQGRQHPAYPGPLLSLDALDGPQRCRRDGGGVGLGDLLLPFASPRCWVGSEPQRDVGRLHRLPHHHYEVVAQGVEVRPLPELRGEILKG